MDIRSFFKPPKNNLPPTKARDVDESDENVVDLSTGSSSAVPRPAQPFVPSFVREHHEIARAPAGTSTENELWTQKYAPKKTSDLVGNPQAIQNVSEWLRTWEAVHITKTMSVSSDRTNQGGRGLFISGPPGIGKSSSVSVIAHSLGFEITELNASDARSALAIRDLLNKATQNSILNFAGKAEQKKRVIIMDEVDGMSSSDRGGVSELIKFIASSRVPIVCICNEVKPALKTLKSKCFEVKFIRPQAGSIEKRLRYIADCENLEIDSQAIEIMVKSSGNDVRHIINDLQMWSRTQKQATTQDISGAIDSMNKDQSLRYSFFDAAQGIFDPNKTFAQKEELFFVDYSIMPLVVAEKAATASWRSRRSEEDNWDHLARVADSVCDLDIVAARMFREMDFSFLPLEAAMSVRAVELSGGTIGFPGFPEWMGRNSAALKRMRMLKEIAIRLRAPTNTTRLDYLEPLRESIIAPLRKDNGALYVNTAVDIAIQYSLTRDDIFDSMVELQFCSDESKWGQTMLRQFPNAFAHIPSAVKSAFTRLYKKRVEDEGLDDLVVSMASDKVGADYLVLQPEEDDEDGTEEANDTPPDEKDNKNAAPLIGPGTATAAAAKPTRGRKRKA
jgi:replication factor C subunit 1